jgi:DNA-binding CsgD family transcriptional regulator
METQQTTVMEAATAEPLTPREQEIFTMLLNGSTPKEIAYNLKITYGTVVNHQKSIYSKLGVHNINEFMVKFRSAGVDSAVIPARNKKKYPQLKFILPIAALVFITVMILFFLLPPKSPRGIENYGFVWYPICDEKSTSKTKKTDEKINGETKECIIMSGTMSDYLNAYSCIEGKPDIPTLEDLKTMKSFSFQAMGDGGNYHVRLLTRETADGDAYLFNLRTIKDEIISVTVNVPDDLFRLRWSGKDAEFIQDNIIFFQILVGHTGPYHLKFWDIRFHK